MHPDTTNRFNSTVRARIQGRRPQLQGRSGAFNPLAPFSFSMVREKRSRTTKNRYYWEKPKNHSEQNSSRCHRVPHHLITRSKLGFYLTGSAALGRDLDLSAET